MQPEVYLKEYLTIQKVNAPDCPSPGRVPQGFEESLYLKDTLDKVKSAAENDTFKADAKEVKELLAEFKHIQSAIADFQKNCTNKDLVKELSNPGGTENGEGWLQALDNVAKAGEALFTGRGRTFCENT